MRTSGSNLAAKVARSSSRSAIPYSIGTRQGSEELHGLPVIETRQFTDRTMRDQTRAIRLDGRVLQDPPRVVTGRFAQRRTEVVRKLGGDVDHGDLLGFVWARIPRFSGTARGPLQRTVVS